MAAGDQSDTGSPTPPAYSDEQRAIISNKLNVRQQAFVLEYLLDLNAAQAARRAGYKKAAVRGPALLKMPAVRAALKMLQYEREMRVKASADDVLRELTRIALSDVGQAFDENGALRPMHEIPEDTRRAMSSVDVQELYEGTGADRRLVGYLKKVRFWSKESGLDKLGRHHRLFDTAAPVDPEEVALRIRQLVQEMDDADVS
jgi:phage terminase small subunit